MPFLRKYGTGTGADVYIPIIKAGVVDFAVTGDWSPAAGDVKISIDGGAAANIGTLPVINGTHDWKFVFADAELQGKTIRVRIVDSATKAVEDQSFTIETYGHASAMYKPDFSDSVRLGLTALPNAAAEAAGGLYTRGTGAGQLSQTANGELGVVTLTKTLTTYTGNTPQTGDSYAIVNSGTHGNAALKTLIDVIDGIVDSILDDTGTSGVVLNAAGLATDAVNEIRNAITGGAYALDTDANGRIRIVDGTGTGELSTTSGLLDWNPAWDAEVQSEAEDALVVHRLDELLNADSDIDGLAPPTVGSVFHELLSKTAGSFTYDQTTDSLEALRDRGDAAWITATGFSTHSAADVWAVATRVLTAGTNIALAKGTGVTGFNDLDAAGIRTAVGLATANLDTQLDALPTANEVRNAVTGGAYALDTDANGRVRIVDGTGAGEIDTTSGGVLVASLATQAKADVNAEVVDAFATDTYAEPSQGTPPATASLSTKLNWLYMAWRNKKTQTSSLLSLFADDASTVAAKSTVSDDGTTFTAGEFTTGA